MANTKPMVCGILSSLTITSSGNHLLLRTFALFISDRERGQLSLPKKKVTPTLTEYGQQYLAFHKREKENTRLVRIRAIQTLSRYLGNYKLDKL
ncbi:MAG: hypothetical protein E3K32_05775 [wastewater metagenome]|nr:hypothetical protein [Candidatus Loosdrechtia aerotolerans]